MEFWKKHVEGKNTQKRKKIIYFCFKFNIFLFSQDLPSFLNCQNKYDPTIRTGNKLLHLNLTAGKAMLDQNHRKNKDRAGARDQKNPKIYHRHKLGAGTNQQKFTAK